MSDYKITDVKTVVTAITNVFGSDEYDVYVKQMNILEDTLDRDLISMVTFDHLRPIVEDVKVNDINWDDFDWKEIM